MEQSVEGTVAEATLRPCEAERTSRSNCQCSMPAFTLARPLQHPLGPSLTEVPADVLSHNTTPTPATVYVCVCHAEGPTVLLQLQPGPDVCGSLPDPPWMPHLSSICGQSFRQSARHLRRALGTIPSTGLQVAGVKAQLTDGSDERIRR